MEDVARAGSDALGDGTAEERFGWAKAFLAQYLRKSLWKEFVLNMPAENVMEYVIRAARALETELASIADMSEDEDPELVASYFELSMEQAPCTWEALRESVGGMNGRRMNGKPG